MRARKYGGSCTQDGGDCITQLRLFASIRTDNANANANANAKLVRNSQAQVLSFYLLIFLQ